MSALSDQTGQVVVGCDGSWHSEAAVSAATHEAVRRGVPLVLLTVADQRIYRVERLSWIAQLEAEARQSAVALAERAEWAARHTDPAVVTRIVVARDFEDERLLELAAQASLLVLGPHGRGGQVVFSLGSMSAELARLFGCPLLVVCDELPTLPGLSRRPAVLVGLAEHGPTAAVLEAAAEQADLRGTSLIVVHSVGQSAHVEGAELETAWETAESALKAADLGDIPHRLIVSQEAPVQALVDHAQPHDLLVVGTRGGGRLAGLVSGSVCRGVLDAMPCDVLVVPPATHLAPVAAEQEPTGLATQESTVLATEA